jgi:hypothetical protein
VTTVLPPPPLPRSTKRSLRTAAVFPRTRARRSVRSGGSSLQVWAGMSAVSEALRSVATYDAGFRARSPRAACAPRRGP